MKKLGKLRIVLVGLIIWGAVLGVGLPVVAATPWSGTVSYSLRDQAQFQVGYQLNDLFGLDLAYQDLGLQELTGNRWQTRLLLTPGDRRFPGRLRLDRGALSRRWPSQCTFEPEHPLSFGSGHHSAGEQRR